MYASYFLAMTKWDEFEHCCVSVEYLIILKSYVNPIALFRERGYSYLPALSVFRQEVYFVTK